MSKQGLGIAFILCIFFVSMFIGASDLSAAEKTEPLADWRSEKAGPTFADMIDQAANVVFAQVTNVTASTVELAISYAIKGSAGGSIVVTGMKKKKYIRIKDSRKFFSPGDDFFFFLNAAMVGSLPFEPISKSVIIKVSDNKVKVSILNPTNNKFPHELDYELFDEYLKNLVAKSKGQIIDSAFLGKLVQNLENSVKSANQNMAPTFLMMVLQIDPTYDNEEVLFAMLDSADVNSRLIAIQALTEITKRSPKVKDKKSDRKKKKKKKSKKSKRRSKKGKSYKEKIYKRFVVLLKTDKTPIVQSVSAMALAVVHDKRAIEELASMIEKVSRKDVNRCEVYPALGEIEAPKNAVVRAIVEFEGDDSLDVLERELRRDEVSTFRLILEIFRDYADMNLNLLLLDLLQDRNFLPRQVAILEYFHSVKDDETIEGLKGLFLSPEVGSEYIRKSIIEVFEDFREPNKTVPFLIKNGLHDPSSVVRQATARALGNLGDVRAVDEFKNIYFKESNRLAREFYVEALAKIKSRLANECLLWLQNKETDAHMLKQIKFALKKSKYLSQ